MLWRSTSRGGSVGGGLLGVWPSCLKLPVLAGMRVSRSFVVLLSAARLVGGGQAAYCSPLQRRHGALALSKAEILLVHCRPYRAYRLS